MISEYPKWVGTHFDYYGGDQMLSLKIDGPASTHLAYQYEGCANLPSLNHGASPSLVADHIKRIDTGHAVIVFRGFEGLEECKAFVESYNLMWGIE